MQRNRAIRREGGKTYLRFFGERKAKDGRTIGWPETWAGQQGKLEVPAQAWLSVQPHVLGSRLAIEEFLKARGLTVQVYRLWNENERGEAIKPSLRPLHGLLRFRLIEASRAVPLLPIPTLTPDVLEHGGEDQPPSVSLTYADIEGVTLAGRPQNVSRGDNRMMHPTGFSMLSATSKMETWSFNVPAGPKALGGTCPGSAFAFPFSSPREVTAGLSALAKKQLVPADISNEKEAVERFVCGACYAIKGNYGNPSNVWAIQLRLHVVERLLAMASKSGLSSALADVLILAVFCGNERARRDIEALAARKKGSVGRLDLADRPNPGFFRIHDAGDMFSAKYFQAWLDVCRYFDTGDENHIWFWAPTRVWMTGVLKEDLMRRVPRNLALRPSGLFFRDPNYPEPAPARKPSGGGFSAASVAGPHDTDAPPGFWNCPASKGPEDKGGALRDPKTGQLYDSSCARAYGPNDEPQCRACWTHHDKVIVYKEH